MFKNTKNMILIILFLVVAVGGFFVWDSQNKLKTNESKKSEENILVEKSETSKEDLIRLISPKPEDVITNPLVIKGEARGNWFFEASFPVILTDWDGRIIAQAIATAKSDWMTEDFVPFEATIEFEKPEFIGDFSKRGALILKKDNPSGLPEHDDALEITVFFE